LRHRPRNAGATIEQACAASVGKRDEKTMLKKMLAKEIQGTGGGDKIVGTDENDVIRAGAGNDRVDAGFGQDEVDGGDGDDVLYGDDGDDSLNGGRGADILVGGHGSDFLDIRFDPSEAPSADLLYGGTGGDVYGIDHAGDIVFEEAESTHYPDMAMVRIENGGWYAHANVEVIFAVSDTVTFLVGNAGDNEIHGGAGDELLLGGAGNDRIFGGGEGEPFGGNDSMFGEDGNDSLFGVFGNDYLAGGAGFDRLYGGDGADALYGEDGDDLLHGGEDFVTDILVGGAGNDELYGAGGMGDYDLMDGGSGDDAYYVDTPADLTFEAAGGGYDTVYATIEGAGVYLYAHVDALYVWGNTSFGVGNELGNFISARDLQGNAASANNVALLGGAGHDLIWGNDVTNGIYGEDGNDNLYGYGGNDVIDGGTGRDFIDGGAGNDIMVGGAAGDRFYVRASGASSIDYILDFEDGLDQIQIHGYTDFAALQPHISQQGADAVIEYATGQFLVIQNLNIASLSGADFVM
jgi:Ca2+-binding RTX toxin-like protein